jgi:cell division protein FtsZ
MRIAEAGVLELKKHVDTLIVIPNQNLFRIANERTTFAEAFVLADQVLYSGIACIVDLIVKEGLINLDLADVRTVLGGMGTAMMGTGEASGDRRAILAAEEAISNPLLDEVSLRGAKGLLLSIIGGRDLTLYEVDEAASRIRQEVDTEANIIVGATFDETLGDRVRVSIVASGMSRPHAVEPATPRRDLPPGWPEPISQRPGSTLPPPLPGAARPIQGLTNSTLSGALAHNDPPSGSPGAYRTEPVDRSASVQGAAGGPASESVYAGDTFVPQPPAEVRRVSRRMPDLEDFPEVGQRDYRAKQSGAASGDAGTRTGGATPTTKKSSLLQRLVGTGRKQHGGEPHPDERPAPVLGSAHRRSG